MIVPHSIGFGDIEDRGRNHGEGNAEDLSSTLHILTVPTTAERDDLRLRLPDLRNVRLQLPELPLARHSCVVDAKHEDKAALASVVTEPHSLIRHIYKDEIRRRLSYPGNAR